MFRTARRHAAAMIVLSLWSLTGATAAAEDWRQLKFDCRHSGDVPDRTVDLPLGLVGAVPLTDAV